MDQEIKQTLPFDYDSIRNDVLNNLNEKGLDARYQGSNISQIASLIAYGIQTLNTQTAANINETLLPLAKKEKNILQAARILGYERKSKTSFIYQIKLIPKKLGKFTIEKYSLFSLGGKNFYYMGKELYYDIKTADDMLKTVITLNIKEGELLKYDEVGLNYRMDGKHHYVDIPFDDIEENGLDVYVTYFSNNKRKVKELWYKAGIFDKNYNTDLSNKYFRQDNLITKTPRIYFKIADIGNNLPEGSIVEINALKTSGADGAPTNNTLELKGYLNEYLEPKPNYIPIEITKGSDEELLEDIRERAPLVNNTDSRCVTGFDYSSVCETHDEIEKSFIWGGEDELPIRIGNIYYALVPKTISKSYIVEDNGIVMGSIGSGSYQNQVIKLSNPYNSALNHPLTETIINNIKNKEMGIYSPGVLDIISKLKLPALRENLKAPVYMFMDLWIDLKKIDNTRNISEIREKIFNSILDYMNNISYFEADVFKSNILQRVVDVTSEDVGVELRPNFQLLIDHNNRVKTIRSATELNDYRCYISSQTVTKDVYDKKLIITAKLPITAKLNDVLKLKFNKKIALSEKNNYVSFDDIKVTENDLINGYINKNYNLTQIPNLNTSSLICKINSNITGTITFAENLTITNLDKKFIFYSTQITDYLYKAYIGIPDFCQKGDIIELLPNWIKDLKIGEKTEENENDRIIKELCLIYTDKNQQNYLKSIYTVEQSKQGDPNKPFVVVDTYKLLYDYTYYLDLKIQHETYIRTGGYEGLSEEKFKQKVNEMAFSKIKNYDDIFDSYLDVKHKIRMGIIKLEYVDVTEEMIKNQELLKKQILKNNKLTYVVTNEDINRGYVELSRPVKGNYAGLSKPLYLNISYYYKPSSSQFLEINVKNIESDKPQHEDINKKLINDEITKQNITIINAAENKWYYRVVEKIMECDVNVWLPGNMNYVREGDVITILDSEDLSFSVSKTLTYDDLYNKEGSRNYNIAINVKKPEVYLKQKEYIGIGNNKIECFDLENLDKYDNIIEIVNDDKLQLNLDDNINNIDYTPSVSRTGAPEFKQSVVIDLLYNYKNTFDVRNLIHNLEIVDPESGYNTETNVEQLQKLKYRVVPNISDSQRNDYNIGSWYIKPKDSSLSFQKSPCMSGKEIKNESKIYFNYLDTGTRIINIEVNLYEKTLLSTSEMVEALKLDPVVVGMLSSDKPSNDELSKRINLLASNINKQLKFTTIIKDKNVVIDGSLFEKRILDLSTPFFTQKNNEGGWDLFCWTLNQINGSKHQTFNLIHPKEDDLMSEGPGGVYAYLNIPYDNIFKGNKLDVSKLPRIDTQNAYGGKDVVVDMNFTSETIKFNFPLLITPNMFENLDMSIMPYIKFPIYAVGKTNGEWDEKDEWELIGTYTIINSETPYIRLKFKNYIVNPDVNEYILLDVRYNSDNFKLSRNTYLRLRNIYFDTMKGLERDERKIFKPNISTYKTGEELLLADPITNYGASSTNSD